MESKSHNRIDPSIEPTARGVEKGKSKSHRIDPRIRTNSKRNRIKQKKHQLTNGC